MSRQLRLDLAQAPDHARESFVVSDCNAAAVALLDAPERWHGGVLALVGPAGSGKTHLADAWAERQRAFAYDPAAPFAPQAARAEAGPVLWEDADRTAGQEEALFHLINIAGRGGRLLLTGRTPPRDWPVALPDLRSRLNALTVAELGAPDQAVMGGVLTKLFRERNIRPTPEVLPYLLLRIERSVPAARELVRRLDEFADAEGRAVTRALAARVLEPDLFDTDHDE